MEQFARTALLIGQEGVEKLHAARVAVFGIGGVGGHATESLVRCGVGTVDIFDDDRVSLTNLNRQLIATHDTIGRPKVEAMAERLHSINPRMQVNAHQLFYMPDQAENIDFSAFDYILDCIDTVTAKLDLVCRAHALGVRHGRGQPHGSHPAAGGRYLRDTELPPGPGDATGAAQARHPRPEGGILHRARPVPTRGRKRYGPGGPYAPCRSRQHGVRAPGDGDDHGLGGGQGFAGAITAGDGRGQGDHPPWRSAQGCGDLERPPALTPPRGWP